MPIVDHVKSKSLKSSFFTGIFGCSMTGFTEDFFTPFLLVLGAPASYVGIMKSLTSLFPSLIQLSSPELMLRFRSRKSIVMTFVFLQAIILLSIAMMAYYSIIRPILFIGLVTLFATFGALTQPCWVSLLSDLVHPNRRGTYFGWRSRSLGFITATTTLLAGVILSSLSNINKLLGFTLIFAIACLCRILSFIFIIPVKEPAQEFSQNDQFSFIQFIRQYKKSNFVRFTVFVAAMNFSVNLAAPFFAVFMLKDLKFSYFLFTVVNIIAPIAIYSTIHRWGIHADRVGNIKIIKFIAPLIGAIPLLWIINQSPLFLVGAELVSGFLWAGFNLCTSNFIMDAVSPSKRTRCIAYFSLINGVALAMGAIVGGFLIHILPPFLGYKILTLFFISALMRILVGLVFALQLKEVRTVIPISSHQLLFSMIGVKPIAGIDSKNIQF